MIRWWILKTLWWRRNVHLHLIMWISDIVVMIDSLTTRETVMKESVINFDSFEFPTKNLVFLPVRYIMWYANWCNTLLKLWWWSLWYDHLATRTRWHCISWWWWLWLLYLMEEETKIIIIPCELAFNTRVTCHTFDMFTITMHQN